MKKYLKLTIIVLSFLYGNFYGQSVNDHSKDKNLKCSTCHSCEVPTKSNPCLIACPRFEMVTVHTSADAAPDVIILDELKNVSDLYAPVTFSHKLHAEMSFMSGGCSTCHHYNPPGRIYGCSECHETSRNRKDISKPDLKGAYHRQCMDCHRKWSFDTSCDPCHAVNSDKQNIQKLSGKSHPKIEEPEKVVYETSFNKGKYVTFFHNEHINLYGKECKDCHTNSACADCHSVKKVEKSAKTLEEHHATCSKCHDTKSTNKCDYCHSQSVKEPFNHFERTGWALNKFHIKLNCQKCHTTPNKFTGLNRSCNSCHGSWNMDNFNHKVTNLELDETHASFECENCHKNPDYSKPDCSDCHDDMRYPKNIPGKLIKSGSK